MSIEANELIQAEINDAVVSAYQNQSLLGLFPSIGIGDIGVEDWYHKKLDDIPDAALTLAGFNPSEAKLNTSLIGFKVFTAAEALTISEKEWAQFSRWGLDAEGMRMLGAKVAQMASTYLFTGLDKALTGTSPHTQYNYINYAGSGTLAAPSLITQATVGGWATALNKALDTSRLKAQLVSKGYNPATSIVFYPRVAEASMTARSGTANYDLSALDMLRAEFMACQAIPDEYMPTAAGAAPTNILFDLYAVDVSQVEIGYTRPETSQVIAPLGRDRNHYCEAEVWFCPFMVPRPWVDGSIYKGVSRITAIAP